MRRRKVILHTGVSLDGYIARTDGSIDWLTSITVDHGYTAMLAGCDTVLMGRKTFSQVQSFLNDGTPFPYNRQTTFVFTKKPKKLQLGTLPVTATDEDPVAVVKRLLKDTTTDKHIHLVGGGALNGLLLKENLVHEIHLSVIPVVLGSGIKLFAGLPDPFTYNFRLVSSTTFVESSSVNIVLQSIKAMDDLDD